MYRLALFMLLLTISLLARYEAKPIRSCEAFNNMKHTQNTHHVTLDTSKTYTVLKHHKGQNLILIKGEQPAQRWVDDSCFPQKSKLAEDVVQKGGSGESAQHPKRVKKELISQKQNILVLTWHNAFCETHRYKKECKKSLFPFGEGKYKERHFVLHGLWPQPRGNQYCGVNSVEKNLDKHKQWHRLSLPHLGPELESRLKKVMPGVSSNLHKHEWVKHGTCYSSSASEYYEDSVSLVEQFNSSKVGQFFGKHIGQRVSLQQIRTLFDRSFGQGTGKRVEMKCTKGMITELWLHLGSGSDDLSILLKRGKQTRSYCTSGRIDKAGFNG